MLTKEKQQAKDIKMVSKSLYYTGLSARNGKQTTAMFALKAHPMPIPSPDAYEGLLGLGPSGAGWAQVPG